MVRQFFVHDQNKDSSQKLFKCPRSMCRMSVAYGVTLSSSSWLSYMSKSSSRQMPDCSIISEMIVETLKAGGKSSLTSCLANHCRPLEYRFNFLITSLVYIFAAPKVKLTFCETSRKRVIRSSLQKCDGEDLKGN